MNTQDRSTGHANEDERTVARTTAELLDAVNQSDVAGVLAVWADDGILMPPHHPSVRGRLEIERYFSQLFQRTRLTFSFTASQILVSGDIAFERLEYASMRPDRGGGETRDIGKGLHVYRREPSGSWRLAMDIWNSDIPGRAGP